MEAYLWVTDDVLNQIRFLDCEGNDNIRKAQQIIDRIYRRDLYKLVGEKRIKCMDGPVSSVCCLIYNYIHSKRVTFNHYECLFFSYNDLSTCAILLC